MNKRFENQLEEPEISDAPILSVLDQDNTEFEASFGRVDPSKGRARAAGTNGSNYFDNCKSSSKYSPSLSKVQINQRARLS